MIQGIVYKMLELFSSNHDQKKISDLILEGQKNSKNQKDSSIFVFDVGCYRGTWSSKIIKIFKKKSKREIHVRLFDVNPKSKIYLKKLIKTDNIIFNNLALCEEKGEKTFYLNNFFEPSGSSLDTIYMDDKLWVKSRHLFMQFFSLRKLKGFSTIKVNTETLDNYCEVNNINKIDILKMDVEGSEKRVLFGAKKMLKKIKVIYTEIVEKKEIFEQKEKEIKEFLEQNNFFFLQKENITTVSTISNVFAKDYIFLNKSFFMRKCYHD